jgi:hypothetical protein
MKRKGKAAAAQVAVDEKRGWIHESALQSETFSVEEDVNDFDSSTGYQVRHKSFSSQKLAKFKVIAASKPPLIYPSLDILLHDLADDIQFSNCMFHHVKSERPSVARAEPNF